MTCSKQKNAADFSSRALEAKSRLRSRLNAAENAVDPVTKRRREPAAPSRPLREGDTVLLLDIGKEATGLNAARFCGQRRGTGRDHPHTGAPDWVAAAGQSESCACRRTERPVRLLWREPRVPFSPDRT